MKRAHDLATMKDVYWMIRGAMADFETRLKLAGVNLPEYTDDAAPEMGTTVPTTGTPCA